MNADFLGNYQDGRQRPNINKTKWKLHPKKWFHFFNHLFYLINIGAGSDLVRLLLTYLCLVVCIIVYERLKECCKSSVYLIWFDGSIVRQFNSPTLLLNWGKKRGLNKLMLASYSCYLYDCRTLELSDFWAVRLSSCRTKELSD